MVRPAASDQRPLRPACVCAPALAGQLERASSLGNRIVEKQPAKGHQGPPWTRGPALRARNSVVDPRCSHRTGRGSGREAMPRLPTRKAAHPFTTIHHHRTRQKPTLPIVNHRHRLRLIARHRARIGPRRGGPARQGQGGRPAETPPRRHRRKPWPQPPLVLISSSAGNPSTSTSHRQTTMARGRPWPSRGSHPLLPMFKIGRPPQRASLACPAPAQSEPGRRPSPGPRPHFLISPVLLRIHD
jgi:hypothetical protein